MWADVPIAHGSKRLGTEKIQVGKPEHFSILGQTIELLRAKQIKKCGENEIGRNVKEQHQEHKLPPGHFHQTLVRIPTPTPLAHYVEAAILVQEAVARRSEFVAKAKVIFFGAVVPPPAKTGHAHKQVKSEK